MRALRQRPCGVHRGNKFQKAMPQNIQIGGKGPTVGMTMTEPGRPPAVKLYTNKCCPDTIDPRLKGK